MPTHSSSSHSSSSHSSSSSNSHSSSSHSSSSYRSRNGSDGRPISSYPSTPPTFHKTSSEFTRNKSTVGCIVNRERHNQPEGYSQVFKGKKAYNYYGETHNYQYYSDNWTYDGIEYKKGYYDENGDYYEHIAFELNGTYYGLECECRYCKSISKLDWKNGEVLKCPKCGGDVDIKTPIDVYTQDPEYTFFKEVTEAEYYHEDKQAAVKDKIKELLLGAIVIVPMVLFFLWFIVSAISSSVNRGNNTPTKMVN